MPARFASYVDETRRPAPEPGVQADSSAVPLAIASIMALTSTDGWALMVDVGQHWATSDAPETPRSCPRIRANGQLGHLVMHVSVSGEGSSAGIGWENGDAKIRFGEPSV